MAMTGRAVSNDGDIGGPSGKRGYCLIDTGLGPVGLAWSGRGLIRLQLPEADAGQTQRALIAAVRAATPARPPDPVQQAIRALKRYATGARVDFADIALDLEGVAAFYGRVYTAARGIGWGETASYGDLARALGAPGAARAVGLALKCNPVAIIIPCHRVLASGGKKLGGFSAFGGAWTKRRLLALEGAGAAGALPLLPGLPPPRR